MASTFSIKTVVVEEAEAWVGCAECKGKGEYCLHCVTNSVGSCQRSDLMDCPSCQGAGGAWHSLIKDDPSLGLMLNTQGKIWFPFNGTKSSTLTREWALCSECEGSRYKAGYQEYDADIDDIPPCNHCHKDADSNPTGAELGTQGEWEVKG